MLTLAGVVVGNFSNWVTCTEGLSSHHEELHFFIAASKQQASSNCKASIAADSEADRNLTLNLNLRRCDAAIARVYGARFLAALRASSSQTSAWSFPLPDRLSISVY